MCYLGQLSPLESTGTRFRKQNPQVASAIGKKKLFFQWADLLALKRFQSGTQQSGGATYQVWPFNPEIIFLAVRSDTLKLGVSIL